MLVEIRSESGVDSCNQLSPGLSVLGKLVPLQLSSTFDLLHHVADSTKPQLTAFHPAYELHVPAT